MENTKYIMVGTPIITKELFRQVLRPLNTYGLKPSGGFWASPHISNSFTISKWFTYLTRNATSIARYKDLNNSVIFSLKEDSKILTINSVEQVMELCLKYPSYHQILGYHNEITESRQTFDYEQLSKDYDGIYIDYDYFQNQFKTEIFDSFSCNSLLLFNLDCIQEYQTAPIIFDIDSPYSIPYIKEETIGYPKTVEEESVEHIQLTNLTEEVFIEKMFQHNIVGYTDYDNYLTKIMETAANISALIEHNEQQKILTIQKKLKDNKINVENSLIIQNIILNYLTNYLQKDINRIKTLPKNKLRELKKYTF